MIYETQEREAVRKLLVEFKEKHVLSRSQMARLLGVTPRTVDNWRRGETSPCRSCIERFRRVWEAFENGARSVTEVLAMTDREKQWRARQRQELERRSQIDQRLDRLSRSA